MSTPRHRSGSLFVTSLLALALGACGVAVAPYDRDGGGGDGSSNADGSRPDAGSPDERPDMPPGCVLPDGTTVPIGSATSDGCNTCVCQPTGALECTGHACVDAGVPDDGPLVGGCILSSECGPSEICSAPPGCGTPGTCVVPPGCTDDLVPYCMCDGSTVSGSSTCPPGIFLHRGACDVFTDGGTDGGGPVDASVDSGTEPGSVDCNPNAVLCNAIRPECPAGQTNSVRNRCWGECVPIRACLPIRCTPTGSGAPGGGSGLIPPPQMCPQNTYCSRTTFVCIEDAPGG